MSHTITPARLKPGLTPEAVTAPAGVLDAARSRVPIRGKALIFWDLKIPGKKKKLDAIDTDQITPAADCVSESLETLDQRWKAGSFRYLMPDFRERVHRGETFLIAGDRFAIGSSREMSPAGLKGVAEEAGLEMVVVCGGNMGDIFRRNALNLGLHVVQSPEAVADARDGDQFSFDPETRRLTNDTQKKTYTPVPLTEKEDEIRRTGGIVAAGRREFRTSVRTTPRIEWPDEDEARRMTTTEQIVWAHRVDKQAEVRPGTTLRVYADLLPASDGTAPFAIHTFNQITGGHTIFPRQAAIANDHFVFTGKRDDDKQTAIGRDFARLHGIEKPYYATPGDGIFHFYFPEQGLVVPGQFIPGADSHSRAYGAYGAVGIGVGSTTLGFGWSTGYIYFTVAGARRVILDGRLQPWVGGKDIVLDLLRRWGARQSQGMSVEFVDRGAQLPVAYRNTIANMMAEAEALNGIFAVDDVTLAWYRAKGITNLPYPPIRPGADAHFEIDETLDLSDVRPMIAKPFSPGNAFPATDVARERITFDKALIAAVFQSVGGEVRQSWCGPCFGQGPDALQKGERAITSFNRNWQNRMGLGGEGYLASPAVVAASALLGYMAPPDELGLPWNAEDFGV
jgi:3-isopropylmalate/(R)-2-methylmalate dehydratase large subunit